MYAVFFIIVWEQRNLKSTNYHAGSHKERFGEDGKGKGLEGRKELADDSGYVGNYKGAETYDKTH